MTASYGGSEDSLATTRSIDSDEKDTSPAEERERITRLEIAVNWIKQAVEDLRESDQVIYREFEKIRLAIEEIKETRQQEEKKMAEENLFDEYFGTLFGTRKATTKVKVQGRSASLQLPILNNGRKPSQTLV